MPHINNPSIKNLRCGKLRWFNSTFHHTTWRKCQISVRIFSSAVENGTHGIMDRPDFLSTKIPKSNLAEKTSLPVDLGQLKYSDTHAIYWYPQQSTSTDTFSTAKHHGGVCLGALENKEFISYCLTFFWTEATQKIGRIVVLVPLIDRHTGLPNSATSLVVNGVVELGKPVYWLPSVSQIIRRPHASSIEICQQGLSSPIHLLSFLSYAQQQSIFHLWSYQIFRRVQWSFCVVIGNV